MLRRKSKKKESEKSISEGEEALLTLDKSQFSFYRCHNVPSVDRLEGRYKIKIGSWTDRYLILYCEYVLYYEVVKGSPVPHDGDLPVGAIDLDKVELKSINFCEEKVSLGGLIPKSSSYENCIELKMDTGKKVYDILIQFDSEENTRTWLSVLRARCKNIQTIKPKFDIVEVRATIDMLINKYPITNHIKSAPASGQEEAWLQNAIGYWKARNKYRKDLRRSKLFSTVYSTSVCRYIDWFVMSGGEAGAESLEKELMMAEDLVVNGWKKNASEGLNTYEEKIASINPEDADTCYQALLEVVQKVRCAEMYIKYYSEVYPSTDLTEVESIKSQWSYFIRLLQGYLDKIMAKRREESEGALRRLEAEKQSENLFWDQPDAEDDPFSDINIVKL
ncbi:uncharacterized protein LOC126316459 [Schistocerca gregaria]|uniref:uncharacterized protein LOC126316459 n=1 Tax=Schistocerca gregaria TaxID=7010 RepID=UPI00211E7C60|nr:uncharacterized protein LOC126316459 [Schistocerca gregaria]